MKQLPNHFYGNPDVARATMDRKDLKELLLSTDGCAIIKGSLYNIKSKHLGAGVYRVYVEKKKYK